ncbi:MAG: glycosyltransferase family 4 protein [Flavobacteriales bacterium]|nr:glycosyltransferase family 4 protein [Flavobacteriales bacterium]
MKGLYIRSVYFLGVTAGGSVTHTSGVINSLSSKTELKVIANEKLPEVECEIKIISPILKKIPVFGELFYNLKMLYNLRNLDGENYSFVYQRFSGESFCGAYFASKNKIPFILEFNSSEIWKLKNWSKTNSAIKNIFKTSIQLPIVQKIEKYNLKKAALIVVVSEVLKENLIEFGIDKNKILVNPNGVNTDKFNAIEKDLLLSKSLNLENYFVFGFIGTFGKWHGVMELAQSIILFFDRFPELVGKVKFLIIGDGKLFQEVELLINQSKYRNNVVLTGKIPQQENARFLQICDAFVSPHIPNPDGTKFFGSPTKLFEYMACSKPIIASNLDQIGEVLEHNKTAFLVEPGNIFELASAYKIVFEDKTLQSNLANAAYTEVCSRYTWDAHVDRILGCIEKKLAG